MNILFEYDAIHVLGFLVRVPPTHMPHSCNLGKSQVSYPNWMNFICIICFKLPTVVSLHINNKSFGIRPLLNLARKRKIER